MPTIHVSYFHINAAKSRTLWNKDPKNKDRQFSITCPVRLAFRDACGFDVLVGSDTFEAVDGFAEVEIPMHVQAFIYEFDLWAVNQPSPTINLSDAEIGESAPYSLYTTVKPLSFTLTDADIARLNNGGVTAIIFSGDSHENPCQ